MVSIPLPCPRPHSSHNLALCTTTSHNTSRGQYRLYFLSQNWCLNTDAQAARHKGLPPWLTRDLLEDGSLQVTWQQVPSAMWEDADKDGRQLLAGRKLALDALIPEQLLLTD